MQEDVLYNRVYEGVGLFESGIMKKKDATNDWILKVLPFA
jgi:hypothetical protein